jgi:uncharacterized protein YegP (UPF0339 family)
MQFVVYQDNSSRFHWRLMADDGSRLAVSATSFDSAEDARLSAADVHDHAGTATPA